MLRVGKLSCNRFLSSDFGWNSVSDLSRPELKFRRLQQEVRAVSSHMFSTATAVSCDLERRQHASL